ncbi:MAG: DUF2889 domain-containing protein [Pseudomonadota bacterium]|nr:DUF2889 domain-containing protein [Pseudomonadota bacterium]
MPLPETGFPRKRLHVRNVSVEGYLREDGLWDIEGHLTDVKDEDFGLGDDRLAAGAPLHDLWLRITINEDMVILQACAKMDAIPYAKGCPGAAPHYERLVGLALKPGFRRRVQEVLGGIEGCVHLTELLGPMATTAYQTLSTHRRARRREEEPPFHLDACHAMDRHGEVVRIHYPEWHVKQEHGT